MMGKEMSDKSIKILTYVKIAALSVSAVFFMYCCLKLFNIETRYEGYTAGTIAIAGYVSFITLTNTIKRALTIAGKGDKKYILSICNVIATFLCFMSLLEYHVKLFVLIALFYIGLQVLYVVYKFVTDSKKKASISYTLALAVFGILVILSTAVRGISNLFSVAVVVALIGLMVGVIIEILSGKADTSETSYFPYDFVEWKTEVAANFAGRFKVAVVILLSIVTLYCLLSPLELYVGNILSFSFGWKTFVPILLIIGCIVCILGAVALALFTEATYRVICTILCFFSLMSYIQYMFLNTKLMEEDGSRLKLSTMGSYPTVNLVVWIIGILIITVAFIALKDKWRIVAMGLSGFIAAVQTVAIVSLVVTCITAPAPRYYQLSGDKQFTVAKENNVIILVPDTFARIKLNNLLEYNPDGNYLDIFKDFTYYDKMYSKQHPTLPSLIYLLTGNDAEDGIDRRLTMERVMWQKEAWAGDTCNAFFSEIHDNGYKFYMNIPAPCELVGAYEDVEGKIDNIEYAASNVDKVKLTRMLVSMSIYSCVPYVFKPPFEYFSWDFALLENYGGKQAAYKNEDFYKDVQDGIAVDETTGNKVHMIVWHGFHDEYTNDEFCNYVPPEEAGKVSDEQNSKGVMLCIETYLEKLKDIGRYDDSTIIIMGDHGEAGLHDGCVFVKMPNEEHETVYIDHTDKTYADFRATVIDMIGSENHDKFGDSWVKDK